VVLEFKKAKLTMVIVWGSWGKKKEKGGINKGKGLSPRGKGWANPRGDVRGMVWRGTGRLKKRVPWGEDGVSRGWGELPGDWANPGLQKKGGISQQGLAAGEKGPSDMR